MRISQKIIKPKFRASCINHYLSGVLKLEKPSSLTCYKEKKARVYAAIYGSSCYYSETNTDS